MIARAKVVLMGLMGAQLIARSLSAATEVKLAWDPSASGAAGYNLYSSINGSGQTNVANVGPTTNATVQNLVPGQTYTFFATAYDASQVESVPSVSIQYTVPSGGSTNTPPPTSGANRFLIADSSTRGNWKGVYGTEGFWLAGVQPNLPNFATVTTTSKQWVWVQETGDPRAPQLPGNGADRIAACWYSSTNVDFNITFNDGKFHRVTFYCLDWTYSSRRGQVDLVDLPTGQLLDSRTLTNYANGIYLTYDVTGAVGFRFKRVDVDAVVSAIFFDPSDTPSGPGSGVVNHPPTLQPIPNQLADEGRPLQLALQASDPDPGQTLRYSLGTNVPSGATLNTNTGVFTWIPSANQVPSTNQITLIATDSGSPAMSSSVTFSVIARPGVTLSVATAGAQNLFKGSVQVSPKGTLNAEGSKYILGTRVSAAAQADIGAAFSHWVLNGVTYTQNPLPFTMDSNKTLTAYFKAGAADGADMLLTSASASTTRTAALSSTESATTTLTSTTSLEPTNVYVLEASTNQVEWVAVTNVVATTNQVDTNAVFRIRAATE